MHNIHVYNNYCENVLYSIQSLYSVVYAHFILQPPSGRCFVLPMFRHVLYIAVKLQILQASKQAAFRSEGQIGRVKRRGRMAILGVVSYSSAVAGVFCPDDKQWMLKMTRRE